jgi:hypothetical protein
MAVALVNPKIGRTGISWQEESFDRIIRDEGHLFQVIRCVGSNPCNAGLPEGQWIRWVHAEWEQAGWGICNSHEGDSEGGPFRRSRRSLHTPGARETSG